MHPKRLKSEQSIRSLLYLKPPSDREKVLRPLEGNHLLKSVQSMIPFRQRGHMPSPADKFHLPIPLSCFDSSKISDSSRCSSGRLTLSITEVNKFFTFCGVTRVQNASTRIRSLPLQYISWPLISKFHLAPGAISWTISASVIARWLSTTVLNPIFLLVVATVLFWLPRNLIVRLYKL